MNLNMPHVANLTTQDIKLRQNTQLHQAAVNLEASFLAEMLKEAGFGKARESMGGGPGEEYFSSFMVDVHAKNLAKRGGIGLAETIFEALKEKQNEHLKTE